MCLISIAYKVHPEYPLIVMANRDEFKNRPTQQAHLWSNHPGIIAGKDLKAGGTWLGLNEQTAKLGILTNYRDLTLPPVVNPKSRGHLVIDYLKDDLAADVYWDDLQLDLYEGFNLLLWEKDQLFYGSNLGERAWLKPGIHSLSNHLLNTPWPKVKGVDQAMKTLVESEVTVELAMQLMQNDQKADDDELPQTGIPLPMEQLLSSMFIDSEAYGTRCSTFFKLDRSGSWTFEEWTWKGNQIFRQKGRW